MKPSVEWPVGEKINTETFLRYISPYPFTWWRTEPAAVLIRTGKTKLVVPAASALLCRERLLLHGHRARGCWKFRATGPGLGWECNCCTSLSWHSQHDFRARFQGKNVSNTFKRNTILFFLLAELVFFFSFSFSFFFAFVHTGVAQWQYQWWGCSCYKMFCKPVHF